MTLVTPTRETLMAIRFGYGLPGPVGASITAEAPPKREVAQVITQYRDIQKQQRANQDVSAQMQKLRREMIALLGRQLRVSLARAVSAEDDFFERAAHFWTDHFTVALSQPRSAPFVQPFVDEAIRPNVFGFFPDILKASVKHPAMLFYLDQLDSVGEMSMVAQNRAGKGLNENLAREVLELHTLGVDGSYTQQDVRQLAKLFTGMSFGRKTLDYQFRPALAEPGSETVLGKVYGGPGRAKEADIDAALEDIALHPETAWHISWKLAVHFVSDQPSEVLVNDLTDAFKRTDGDLAALYQVLQDHPDTAASFGAKAKQPWDFIVSSLRALGVTGEHVMNAKLEDIRDTVFEPMQRMGQPWRRPSGPDGWPEAFDAWITPQGIAERMNWAIKAPRAMGLAELDPVMVMNRSLGETASERLRWAVPKAETREQGLALVLASPEFNRR